MIEVTAICKTGSGNPTERLVKVHGFDRLTPRAARAALEIACGEGEDGEVWHGDVGYRIYKRSARKVKRPRSSVR